MDCIEIEGGVQLHGHVRVSGAKNAALPVMASVLLTTGATRLRNVPRVRDVVTFGQVLQALGANISFDGSELIIDTTSIDRFEAPYNLVKTMRASFLVLGPLLARYGQARVSLPGGCAIGARPVNLHLKGLQALGAHLELAQGYVQAYADQLQGATITLPAPTVTGTENIMMAAVLAKGTTIIDNAAREPEVVDLAESLTQMGARVTGVGSSRIFIEGVPRLEPAAHDIIPDRIEGGTFLVAGAMTGGDVTIDHCRPGTPRGAARPSARHRRRCRGGGRLGPRHRPRARLPNRSCHGTLSRFSHRHASADDGLADPCQRALDHL